MLATGLVPIDREAVRAVPLAGIQFSADVWETLAWELFYVCGVLGHRFWLTNYVSLLVARGCAFAIAKINASYRSR